MLLEAIGESRPMAVGLALSPVPIAAVITVLLSARPSTAPVFLLGWVAGILLVGGVVFVLPGLETDRGGSTVLSGWVRILLGVGLLLLALSKWQGRPGADEAVEMLKALAGLDTNGPVKTVTVAFVMSALNPKNLALTFASAVAIDEQGLGPGQQEVALGVYALIASLSVTVPIVGYFLFAERLRPPVLVSWKEWLVRNNAVVVTVLLIAFGALIIGNGLKKV